MARWLGCLVCRLLKGDAWFLQEEGASVSHARSLSFLAKWCFVTTTSHFPSMSQPGASRRVYMGTNRRGQALRNRNPGCPVGPAEVCAGECPCVGLGSCPGTRGTHLFPLLIQWRMLPLKLQLMQSGGCEKVSA